MSNIIHNTKDHCAYPSCGKELTHTAGRRKKKYCKPACKMKHWAERNKNYVPITKHIKREEWEEIQKKLSDLIEKDKPKIKKALDDILHVGKAVVKNTETGIEVLPPYGNEALIAQYEDELGKLGVGQFANQRRKFLQNKIYELKNTKQ